MTFGVGTCMGFRFRGIRLRDYIGWWEEKYRNLMTFPKSTVKIILSERGLRGVPNTLEEGVLWPSFRRERCSGVEGLENSHLQVGCGSHRAVHD